VYSKSVFLSESQETNANLASLATLEPNRRASHAKFPNYKITVFFPITTHFAPSFSPGSFSHA
jgi:hypothetical protein